MGVWAGVGVEDAGVEIKGLLFFFFAGGDLIGFRGSWLVCWVSVF